MVVECELGDFGVEGFEMDGGRGGVGFGLMGEERCGGVKEVVFGLVDVVGVEMEVVGEVEEGVVRWDGGKWEVGVERGGMVGGGWCGDGVWCWGDVRGSEGESGVMGGVEIWGGRCKGMRWGDGVCGGGWVEVDGWCVEEYGEEGLWREGVGLGGRMGGDWVMGSVECGDWDWGEDGWCGWRWGEGIGGG